MAPKEESPERWDRHRRSLGVDSLVECFLDWLKDSCLQDHHGGMC